MQYFISISLIIHIAAGMLALLAGTIAIFSKKGRKNHRFSGKIYFWSMVAVTITAFILSLFKEIPFLLMIAIFSFYMTYTGFISIKRNDLRPRIFDWFLLFMGLITVGFMIFSLNIVLLVFGLIFGTFVMTDLLRYLNILKKLNSYRLILHISRMMGAYIATSTAFFVVNVHFEPAWIVWLLPTIIISPFISYFIRKYGIKGKVVVN